MHTNSLATCPISFYDSHYSSPSLVTLGQARASYSEATEAVLGHGACRVESTHRMLFELLHHLHLLGARNNQQPVGSALSKGLLKAERAVSALQAFAWPVPKAGTLS